MNRTRFLLIVLAIVNGLIACGGSSDRIEKNIQNSQKLRVGMTLDEALKVMGEPYEIKEHANYKGIYDYYFESPFGASDWIYFSIDSTKRVTEVTPYEIKKD